MPEPLTAGIIGGTMLAGSAGSAYLQSEAAGDAASQSAYATQLSIAHQEEQAEIFREIMQPFVDQGMAQFGKISPFIQAGQAAFQEQQDLLGLNGENAYNAAVSKITEGPQFQTMLEAGNENILANASATGNIRGGNTQRALMEFQPALLSQEIQNRYNQLGGVAGTGLSASMDLLNYGQASAAGTAGNVQQTGMNISNLLQNQGAANANAALMQGGAWAGVPATFGQMGGILAGYGMNTGKTIF